MKHGSYGNYGIHAEAVSEHPIGTGVFEHWMEDWEDRIEDAAHVQEGEGRGSAELPDFTPIEDPMLRMKFPH